MEMLEFSFFTSCTCGEELKAELRWENTTIEVEPCKRCLDEAYESGLKKETITPITPIKVEHSDEVIVATLESLRHKLRINTL